MADTIERFQRHDAHMHVRTWTPRSEGLGGDTNRLCLASCAPTIPPTSTPPMPSEFAAFGNAVAFNSAQSGLVSVGVTAPPQFLGFSGYAGAWRLHFGHHQRDDKLKWRRMGRMGTGRAYASSC